MKQKLFILALLLSSITNAQQSIVSSGVSGSKSMTIGLPIWITDSSSTSYSTTGTQISYEVLTLAGFTETDIVLSSMVAFPNPVVETLFIQVENYQGRNLSFHVFDVSGKTIASSSIEDSQTSVNMDNCPAGVYYLIVSNETTVLKQFKIIKK